MQCRHLSRRPIRLLFACACATLSSAAFAAPSDLGGRDFAAERARLTSLLQSGDPQRVNEASTQLFAWMFEATAGVDRGAILMIAVDAKQFDVVEALALAAIERVPESVATIQQMQAVRAKAFYLQGKFPEAVSAAKSFYCVCDLRETSNAVGLLSLCLSASTAEGPALARRFKAQQLEWSTSDPRPAEADNASLGEPIFPTIAIAEPKIVIPPDGPTSSKALIGRGNLYLLKGDAVSARPVFERALATAPNKRAADIAIEGIARSVRAEHGNLGAANAFLESVKAKAS